MSTASPDKGLPGGGDAAKAATHTESEDHPWDINIPDHPGRTDSPTYVASRKRMVELMGVAPTVAAFYLLNEGSAQP